MEKYYVLKPRMSYFDRFCSFDSYGYVITDNLNRATIFPNLDEAKNNARIHPELAIYEINISSNPVD